MKETCDPEGDVLRILFRGVHRPRRERRQHPGVYRLLETDELGGRLLHRDTRHAAQHPRKRGVVAVGDVSAVERELDELGYAICVLTPEETKIVNGVAE